MTDEELRRCSVIAGPHTPEYVLAVLERELPLKHRQLHIDYAAPASGFGEFNRCSICPDGHVHLYVGPMAPAIHVLVESVLGYMLARILDTREQIPKRPTKKSIAKRIDEMLAVITMELDPALLVLTLENLGTLHEWLEVYVGEAVKVAPPKKAPEPRPEPPIMLVPGFAPMINYEGSGSVLVAGDEGQTMLGLLNRPMKVGDA